MIYNKSYGDIVENYLGIPLHTKVKIIVVNDDRGQVWNKKMCAETTIELHISGKYNIRYRFCFIMHTS